MEYDEHQYDPDHAPDEAWWSDLDDDGRLEVVLGFHREAGITLPNETLHAVAHVVIENQVLLGDETPVAAKLRHLREEGLSRHDAIHAIGSVLMPVVIDALQGKMRGQGASAAASTYYEGLEELTAERWLSEGA